MSWRRSAGRRTLTPNPMTTSPPQIWTKRRIKRFAPLQLGMMLGVVYGLLGLLIIPVFLVMSAMAAHFPAQQRVGIFALGAGFAIFVPIIYAAMGFIVGVIGALVYNLVAMWIGGIEVEVE